MKTPRVILKLIFYPLWFFVQILSALHLFPKYTKAMKAARQYGQGTRAYESGDFEKAFLLLKPLADTPPQSFLEAPTLCYSLYYVGLMYFYGQGTRENFEEGLRYFKLAASYDNPEAIEYLKSNGDEYKPDA